MSRSTINRAQVRRFEPLPLPSAGRAKRHAAYLATVRGPGGSHADDCLHATWFAGGGGSSEGAKQALGRDVDYALNHDAVALRMHEVNHPGAITWQCDAYAASPLELEPGREIGTMWFSPDCTDHSKAKGGVPKSPRIRGLAWCIIPWAKVRRPRVILFENVEEWWDWGPLQADGHADKARRGETRARFVKRLAQCGYTGEFRELVTADYGGETTRKRLYGIFRSDGQPIVWPERTHAPRHQCEALGLKPWVGAASFIDFSRPCPSIFLTQPEAKALGYKVKRPLVAATRRRIAQGIKRFVIEAAEPFLVQITHQGGDRVYSPREPINTITGAHRGEFAVVDAAVSPFVAGLAHGDFGRGAGDRVRPVDEPIRTVSAGGGDHAIVAPTLLRTDMTGARYSGVYDAQTPVRTVTGAGGIAVATSELHATPWLFGCGGRRGQSPPLGMDAPAPTMTGKADTWLGAAYLHRSFGSTVSGRDIVEPHPAVMTEGAGGKSGIVAASLIKYYGSALGADVAEPIHTVTGEDRFGLVSAFMEQANTGMVGHAAEEPLSTLVGRGTTQRLIEVGLQSLGVEPGSRRQQVLDFLWEQFGAPTPEQWADPLGSAEARLRFGFVVLGGLVWEIGDIGMRMLSVRELFRAQTFPPDYIIDRDIKGRAITGTQATLMCGNAVPPKVAALLYGGNWPRPEAQRVAA